MGLMIGYPSVALGYLSARAGLPVSAAAAMVGSAFFAHAFKFLWAPLADYSLSRKAWYRIAIGVMAATLLAMTATPMRSGNGRAALASRARSAISRRPSLHSPPKG